MIQRIRKCWPGGKARAFNISYDDGVLEDVPFVELLNRYGLKGTFNLNSGLMQQEFEWIHECGMVVKRLSVDAAAGLYDGHEVASHTLEHPYLHDLSEEEILYQLRADKENLEAVFGREVPGFAVPFDYYSDLIIDCAKKAGFEYVRLPLESGSLVPPKDFYRWPAGKLHWDADLEEFVEGFLQSKQELALCQIAGHAYDLTTCRMWERMECILQKVSRAEDVAPMTHIEIVRYLGAMKRVEGTEDAIVNNSGLPLWFRVDGEVVCIAPEERLKV